MAEKQRRTQNEKIKLGEKVFNMKKRGFTDKIICAKLGIADGSISKIKKAYLDSVEENPPSDLISLVSDEINGHEQVTVAFFNPHEDAEDFNQLTITTTIKSGLLDEERKAAINAAIAKEKLIKWVEL